MPFGFPPEQAFSFTGIPRRGVLKVQQSSTLDFCKLLKTKGTWHRYLREIHLLEGGGCSVSQVPCFQIFSFQWDTRDMLRLVEPC